MKNVTQIKNIYAVSRILTVRYQDFAHHNKKNPLEELFFILCSVRTNKAGYHNTYQAFRKQFPRFEMVAEASAEYIAKPLAAGGLANQKSSAIKKSIDIIAERFGRPTLAPLREMTDSECEQVLTSLPGVGKKVARCVMMYSLDRQVFPVDSHCWRICRRLGWVRRTTKEQKPSPKDMERLQCKIPPELRFSLHVNMVSLGREICLPRKPKCHVCPIEACCRKIFSK